jgi:hydrogenase maturation protein HypF
MSTWYIHITGIVQGVGFRPFVYKLARNMKISGWVKNDVDGVRITICCHKDTAVQFYQKILSDAPIHAMIYSSSIIETSHLEFPDFRIVQDTDGENTSIHLAPDFAICERCKKELADPGNRRYHYPFITCSDCGPRYSITRAVPFDRAQTEMSAFRMCPNCQSEYDNPSNRRFYAQTTSCNDCGVKPTLHTAKDVALYVDNQLIVKAVAGGWTEGKIIAIKGVGGYLITCSAANREAIKALRSRKKRPDKPFALMYPSTKLSADFNLIQKEKEEFSGAISPIVLVQKSLKKTFTEGICDGLDRVGVMIPYAPLFQLLLSEFGEPIVATSGNISNSPIVFQDEKALDELFDIADFVLTYNRKIVVPQDDSVVVYSSYYHKRIILRRSRGMSPSFFSQKKDYSLNSALAMGAQLKSTFTILHHGNIYISQYLGDLENYDAEQNYEQTLLHQINLLDLDPDLIIVDLHQGYSSSEKGLQTAATYNLPVLKVQHHLAHFSALLGEHTLSDTGKRILGVIWDGTGLGSDNNVWGGEFFTYHDHRFERIDHLPYFDHIAGDKMAREPRLAALSLCSDLDDALPMLRTKFTEQEWNVYMKMLQKKSTLRSSSVGRLFDGVASLAGLLDVQSYEGQAASLLQIEAEKYVEVHGLSYQESYFNTNNNGRFSPKEMLREILLDIVAEQDIGTIAAKFHITLVHWIKHIAIKEGVNRIGFSGGVFQNTLLVDLIMHQLQDRYELFFHKHLSPNDENISFGQLVYAEIQSKSAKELVD